MSQEDRQLNSPKREEEILKFWEEHHIFEKTLEQTKQGEPFTFYDGPPFATGLPHYGHILASTIKDVIPRYQTMRGRFVRRRWGWDCHGLPIEEIVERKLGISGKKEIEEKIGIGKFNEICRGTVMTYVNEWRRMIQRIARWVDFDNSYKTMDADYMESVWWAFKQVYEKGLAYEGRRVLLYCPRCETPISNFEVVMDNSYQDVTEEALTVRFKVVGQENTYLLAWTTTPWTLPGNVALAVAEDENYVTIPDPAHKRQWIILAEKRFRDLVEAHAFPPEYRSSIMLDDIDTYKGKDLVGLEYEPLFPVDKLLHKKSYRVYAADFVNIEEGTGVVHTAVVYGEDDYALGVREGLLVVPLLDEKGIFNTDAPKFLHGLYFKDAEKLIKNDLEGRGLLFRREQHTHSYPFCWRCGTQLFYNAIPAWFINIQKLRPALLKSNTKEVNWFPSHLKHGRYEKSVEQAPDWNISRNRFWGNPIPVWRCETCRHDEVIGSLEELSRRAPAAKNRYIAMRHGDAETLMVGVVSSSSAYHLTDKGKAATKKEAIPLGKLGIDFILASPVARAKETADIVAGALNTPVHVDPRLREIEFGVLDGKSDVKYNAFFKNEFDRFEKRPEGGESLGDVQKRMFEVMEDLERKYQGKTILLVSHADPIWILWGVAEGLSRGAMIQAHPAEGEFLAPDELVEIRPKKFPRDGSGEINLHRPYADAIVFPCSKCGGQARRITEIFDSWTEAGSMPFAEYHYPFENVDVFKRRFPAQFVAEYIAQTRAWFYVMHVMSVALFKKAPFENVVTTGTILAEDGSKMSKSKENFPDPWKVIEKYGADSLRLYLMNSAVMQADNLNFSERELETIHRKVPLILLNVCNYFETYVESSLMQETISDESKTVLDQWIEARTEILIQEVTAHLEAYDTVRATRSIVAYVDDLSRWYLRRSRGREDPAFFQTLSNSLLTTATVIAPFMPYLAEAIYQDIVKHKVDGRHPESVHLKPWPESKIKKSNSEILSDMTEVRRLATLALAERAKVGIKVRQPLAKLLVKSLKAKVSDDLLGLLRDEINVKEIVVDPNIEGDVLLDTLITPELREEGLVRELVRNIQEMRRDGDMKPRDEIRVEFKGGGSLKDLLSRWHATIMREVGARTIEHVSEVRSTLVRDVVLGELQITIGITKA